MNFQRNKVLPKINIDSNIKAMKNSNSYLKNMPNLNYLTFNTYFIENLNITIPESTH